MDKYIRNNEKVQLLSILTYNQNYLGILNIRKESDILIESITELLDLNKNVTSAINEIIKILSLHLIL